MFTLGIMCRDIVKERAMAMRAGIFFIELHHRQRTGDEQMSDLTSLTSGGVRLSISFHRAQPGQMVCFCVLACGLGIGGQ
jgi:hypothetical protein